MSNPKHNVRIFGAALALTLIGAPVPQAAIFSTTKADMLYGNEYV